MLGNLQLISNLMGAGFYSSSHLPRFEGVWWPVEGGEVTLNGKAARFHFWLQAPWMLGATKQGFVFMFHRNLHPRWGETASGSRDTAPASSYRALATPGNPSPGSCSCRWPKGVCISASCGGIPPQAHYQLRQAVIRWPQPTAVAGGPVSFQWLP